MPMLAKSVLLERLVGTIQSASALAVPLLIIAILVWGAYKRVPVYEEFVKGAKDGVSVALRILPFLLAMFLALGILRASGALDMAASVLSPVLNVIGVPVEVVPLLIVRPLSGSGSLGILADLLSTHGPDSMIGRMASTIQGSADTTFYIVTVYFGAVGIRKVRHAVWTGLIADIVGFLASIIVCTLVFG